MPDLRLDPAARTFTDYALTMKLVRARKPHHCSMRDSYPSPCLGTIESGTLYVRAVMFPGHDAAPGRYERTRDGKPPRPQVMAICARCGWNYTGSDQLFGLAKRVEAGQ